MDRATGVMKISRRIDVEWERVLERRATDAGREKETYNIYKKTFRKREVRGGDRCKGERMRQRDGQRKERNRKRAEAYLKFSFCSWTPKQKHRGILPLETNLCDRTRKIGAWHMTTIDSAI